jgi:hypothetical protein
MECKLRCAVCALMLAVLSSGVAGATDDSAKGAARELADEAKRDFDAGNFEQAGLKFQRAYQIAQVPTLAVWAARALVKRGQLVAASELYRQATFLAPNDLWVGNAQQQAQADAGRELGELQPRIPKLRIRVDGAAANDVTLTIDEVGLSTALLGIDLPTDPGRRHLVARRGAELVEQTVELFEGDRKEAVLMFGPVLPAPAANMQPFPAPALGPWQATTPTVPAAAPMGAVAPVVPAVRHDEWPTTPAPAMTETQAATSTGGARRTWGWIAVGVGAAGLFTGAATGLAIMSKSGLRNDCPNGTCDPTKVSGSSVNTYNLMRDLSVAGFIVGGIGTAVGATLLLWPSRDSEPRVALWLGPSSAGVKGAF